MEKRINDMDSKFDRILEEIQNLKDNHGDFYNSPKIFREESGIESPAKEVEQEDDNDKIDENIFKDNIKKTSIDGFKPHGGWKTYKTNVKRKNLNLQLKKLEKKFPFMHTEIKKVLNGKKSDFIKVGRNKVNNATISYRDIKEED